MAQAQLQSRAVGIDLGPAVEQPQQLFGGGSVQSLDFSTSLGISHAAIDKEHSQASEHFDRVVSDKARSVIEVKGSHQAVLENGLVEATQEQGGAFRGADHQVECETGGVIEEKGASMS